MKVRPGDPCQVEGCGGHMVVYTTRLNFIRKERLRYMRCKRCKITPENNKWRIPMEYAPPKACTRPSTKIIP